MNKKIIFFICILFILFFSNKVLAESEISINNISIFDKSSTITVEEPTISNNSITSSIVFNKIDDYVIYDVELKNNQDKELFIDKIEDNNSNSNIEITYDYNNNGIKKNETRTIKIKIKYKNQLYNVDEIQINDLEIVVNFNSSDGSSYTLNINNPNTKDSIIKYIIVLFLSFTSLLLLIIKNKYKKIGICIIIVTTVFLLPITIFALSKIRLDLKYSNITIKGEFQYFDIHINNNNSTQDEQNIKYGTLVGTITKPSKNGYEFTNWTDENNNIISDSTPIIGEMNLSANYILKDYNINYDLDGGIQNTNNPNSYTIEDNITLEQPTKLGYRFVGWLEGNSTTPQLSVTINNNTGTLNYKAVWEELHSYMVKLKDSINGNPLASIENNVKTIKFVTLSPEEITAKGTPIANLTDTSKTGEQVYAWAVPNEQDSSLYDVTIGSTALQITLPLDSSWTFNPFRTNLTTVDFGTSVDTKTTVNLSALFNGCSKLTTIIGLNNLDTTSLRYMDWIFQNCSSLTSVDLSNFNTTNVTTMWGLFQGCSSLTSVNLSNFDTSKVTIMNQMFLGDTSLEELDLSSFDTAKVEDFRYMFQNDSNLKSLKLDNFSFASITDRENAELIFSNLPDDAIVNVNSCNIVTWIENNLSKDRDYPIKWKNENFTTVSGDSCTSMINTSYMINLGISPISSIEANVKSIKFRTMAQNFIDEQIEIAENANLWHAELTDTTKTGEPVYAWAEQDDVNPALYNVTIATQASKLYFPEDSGYMFRNLRYNLEYILFNDLVDTSLVTSMAGMFSECTKLYSLTGINNFDTSNVTDFSYMFNRTYLSELDLSNFDTAKGTNFSSMFNTAKITTLITGNKFKTSNAIYMVGMFNGADFSNTFFTTFDTSKVIDMSYMFNGAKFTTIDLTNFNTQNVENMALMLSNTTATNLIVSNLNTIKVTNMTDMFYGAQAQIDLDLSNYQTPALTEMEGMFAISKFTSINISNFDTSHVQSMRDLFYYSSATSIIGLDSLNTSSLITMEAMLDSTHVSTIDISNYNITNVTNMKKLFNDSGATTVKLPNINFASLNNYDNIFTNLSSNTRVITPNCTLADYILDELSLNNKPHGWSYNNVNTSTNSCVLPVQNIQTINIYSDDLLNLSDKQQNAETTIKINDGDKQLYAKMKLQGTSSLSYPKKNYTITFYEDDLYTKKLNIDVNKGWGSQNKYCLKANWIDSTQARNIVSARLAAEMQDKYGLFTDTPNNGLIDGFFVELYVNDEYLGLYTMNIPKDAWMFNMDKNNPNHIVLVGEDPLQNSATTFERLAESENDWEIEVGPNSTPEEVDATLNKLNRLIGFVKDSTNAEFKAHIEEYMNLDALMNYYCFMALSNAVDNMNKNMLLVTYDGLIWYPSLYDLDTTWGIWFSGEGLYSETNRVVDYGGGSSLLFKKLVECFPEELQERYIELRSTVLSNENILAKFNEFLSTATQEQWDREHTKWTTIPGMSYDINQITQHVTDRGKYMDSVMTQLYIEPQTYSNPDIIYDLETPYIGEKYKFKNTGVNLYKENESDQVYTVVVKYKTDTTNITGEYKQRTIFSNKSSNDNNGIIVRNSFDGDDVYLTFWSGNNQYEALWKGPQDYVTLVVTINQNKYTYYTKDLTDIRTITSSTIVPVNNNLLLGALDPEHEYFEGEIKNFTIYNRVFTDDEILAILNG